MKTAKFLFIVVYLIIGYSITVAAQPGNNDDFYNNCDNKYFFVAEVMPAPKVGFEKLLQDLNATVKLQKREKGDFTIDIQMNCKGQTRNIRIGNNGFDENRKEAILTFFRGLEFYPAKQRGRTVNCNFQYLVTYKRGTFTEIKIPEQ